MKYAHLFKTLLPALCCLLSVHLQAANEIPLPEHLPQGHPRLLATDADKPRIRTQIEQEAWAENVYNGILARINPYVEKTQSQPDWLVSRMMMYWKSRATNVYIRGGVYSHADGEAPVPTVRFGSTRGVSSAYKRPKIEDIIPYMDDTKGVFFRNTAKEGSPLEWTEQANVSGSNIESVNEEIMKLAKDAAFVYWLTDDEKYAKFAFDVFDTYITGMYYRNEPVDVGNGHAQTLAGLSTFEVIQERILGESAYVYDFLYEYIRKNHAEKMDLYAATLKKWTDIIIKNGVPHNNWNLHQAKQILKVAMVLDDNAAYADNKGREYYIDYILNRSSARQWALTKFMDYGYNPATGIWNECPGYATGVTKDLTNFIRDYANTFGQNLLPYTPVIKQAVRALPQYLFPNMEITAFGDSYYGKLNTEAVADMVRMAQQYGNRADEEEFTALYMLLNPDAAATADKPRKLPADISSFFTGKPLALDTSIRKKDLSDCMTPTFYAPNVSWFVQRANYDSPENGLMISQYASYGNHAHSNGVAMELYGKGYVLAPESGIGSSYFEKPYLEYYSQFPAHNTVMVNGISKYPEMLSNHPFDLLACHPAPAQSDSVYAGITYSDVYFQEPESHSDQNRLLSIVATGETGGYYVDIFRSKCQRGNDKFHDYFYHNLGTEMLISDAAGQPLDLQPSDEMAFAGGHLFALDYMWDKRSATPSGDYQAVWKMPMPDGNNICMNLWMQGCDGREVFAIKAPSCKAFRANHSLPYDVLKAPFLTLAARQHGQAWTRPFVSVFEPSTEPEGRTIESIRSFRPENAPDDFVGIVVNGKSGRTETIFSSLHDQMVAHDGIRANGTYCVVSKHGNDFVLFLGNGKYLSANGFSVESAEAANVVLECRGGQYFLSCTRPIVLKVPGGKKKGIKIAPRNYGILEW